MFKKYLLLCFLMNLVLNDFMNYEILYKAPKNVLIRFKNDIYTKEVILASRCSCMIGNNSQESVDMRLVIVSRRDQRTQSAFYKVERCFDIFREAWLSGDGCVFMNNISIKPNSIKVENYVIYAIECKKDDEIYTAELNVKNQNSYAISNYMGDSFEQVYQPGDIVTCLNKNKNQPPNSWVLKDGSKIGNVLIIKQNFKECPLLNDSETFSISCIVNNTKNVTIHYSIQDCFHFKYISDLGDHRNNHTYDAGEKISCSTEPFEKKESMRKTYFNPSLPYKVILNKDGQYNYSGEYWMEIPENLKSCTTCKFVCMYNDDNNNMYFNLSKQNIKIATNYKTVIEGFDKNNISYDVPIRCDPKHYSRNVTTVAYKESNARLPYSKAVKANKDIKIKGKDGSSITFNITSIGDLDQKWMIYCTMPNGEISAPIFVKLQYKKHIDISLIFPRNFTNKDSFVGFVYKCQGFKLFFVKFNCTKNCEYLTIHSSKSFSTSFLQTKTVSQKQILEFTCVGYSSLSEESITVVNQSVTLNPSSMDIIPTEVLIGYEIQCQRKTEDDTTAFFYDVNVYFEQNGNTWKNTSDVNNNISMIKIPEKNVINLTVTYCCVDFVFYEKDFFYKCVKNTSLSIIKEIELIFKPELNKKNVTYLDLGTQISCKICNKYTLEKKKHVCNEKPNMKLVITKSNMQSTVSTGEGKVQLPYFSSTSVMDDISSWNIEIICTQPDNSEIKREVRLNSCSKNLFFFPKQKTIFRINESIECSTASEVCRESTLFKLIVITNNIVTTNISEGISVKFTQIHEGENIVKCYLYNNENVSVIINVIVVTPPRNIVIFNYKKVLMVGDSMTCNGMSNPSPSRNWWFIEGPGDLQILDNKLTILPNSTNGIYIYKCEIKNIHGHLEKEVKFLVYNSFLKLNCDENYNLEFLLGCVIIVIIFLVLIVLLLYFFDDGPIHRDDTEF